MRKYAKIFIGLVLLMAFTGVSYADKWNKLIFNDDIAQGISELNQYCLLHDIKAEDVLWANGLVQEELKAGDFVFLPVNQIDMLSIWQNKGAWKPTALIPVNSEAAAKRAEKEVKGEVEVKEVVKEVKKAEVVKKVAEVKPIDTARSGHVTKMEQIPDADLQALLDSFTNPKKSKSTSTAQVEVKKVEPVVTPSQPLAPSKPVELPTFTASTQTKKSETPAKVIANTAKPDKILAGNTKAKKVDSKKQSDPIIILSPNGDPSKGAMRLVIVGDTVEVVRLPENATPRRPSMTDLDHTFGTMPDYLPYYNLTPRSRNDNNFFLSNLNGKMLWPVNGKVSSYFGMRGKRKHEGIDIPMPAGTPIRAAKSGVVSRTGNNSTMGFRGYGNFVLLDHGSGLQSFYAHCLSVAVVQGQRVMQGQIIGYVGNTGRSTANHLHFEVRVNNAKVNPVPYLGVNSQFALR
ncbi:MAG: M23 family metallopeptidase [Synergistaceae bacterium]|nr:M23 family metallopeptidase [Synergistaceae bacterium]MBQ6737802.1 M23 family metallopeptidase [Synergistaceae bacterium]